MNTCLAIVAHEGAERSINDFWPLWDGLGVPIVAFLPDGHKWPGKVIPETVFCWGESAHAGPPAFQRLVNVFDTLAKYSNAEAAVIIEPDCVPLKPQLPMVFPYSLGGWLCRCEDNMWPYAMLPPWTATKLVMSRLAQCGIKMAMHNHPDCLDLTDRWICKAASAAGVRSEMIPGTSGYVWFDQAKEMIRRNGVIWTHGFKNKEMMGDLWPC